MANIYYVFGYCRFKMNENLYKNIYIKIQNKE